MTVTNSDPAFEPVTVDLGTISEADALRLIESLRCTGRLDHGAEGRACVTIANFVELRLNLARRAARAADPVVVER